MRLSASRIRSINRAIARVQSSAWSAPQRTPGHSAVNPEPARPINRSQFVRVVVVPNRKAA